MWNARSSYQRERVRLSKVLLHRGDREVRLEERTGARMYCISAEH
jgi:hypothetical protein